jgi:hypothetical protein
MDAAAESIIQAGTKYEGPSLVPQGQMPDAVVELIGHHDRRPAEERMEWIGDLHLAPQTPGIMRSPRTAAVSAPPPCTA